jgi:nicotinamide mononucleotide transporter
MLELLSWLDASAFRLFGAPISWAEILGDITGALCVYLLARQNMWTWPVGLLNNLFWGWLFFRAKLYADSVLQGVFFALGVYGWWQWKRPAVDHRVRRTSRREWIFLTISVAAATIVCASALSHLTDSPAPVADASVFTLSLAATYGQAHRWLESWWIWILVDVISVPLYVSRALYPTALVYFGFGILCIIGLRAWTRDLEKAHA